MEKNYEAVVSDAPPEILWRVFQERAREIAESKAVWRNWFVLNIVLLFGVALFIFFEFVSETGFFARSWLEFAVALPLVYSAIFFHAQHAKAREYFEEYSFKSVVARSLDASRRLLKEDAQSGKPDEQKKLIDFTIHALQDLYTSPRIIISKHPIREEDVKIGIVEKLGDVFKKFIPGKI